MGLQWLELLVLLNFLYPLLFILMGFVWGKYPQKDMNAGTRCYTSKIARKSQANWDFAQKTAATIFWHNGWVIFCIMCSLRVFTMWAVPKLFDDVYLFWLYEIGIAILIGSIFIHASMHMVNKVVKAFEDSI